MLPATHARLLETLTAHARRLGGDIVQVSKQEFAGLGLSPAPFTSWDVGVNHDEKIVYFSEFGMGGHGMPEDAAEFAIHLIHEMAHVFACRVSPYDMNGNTAGQDELEFFGWEIAMTLAVGVDLQDFWRLNADYGLGSGRLIRELDTTARQQLVTEQLQVAARLGMLQDGLPVSIRDAA